MSQYYPQAGFAPRQGLMEIDPNRVIHQQPVGTGKFTTPPVVSAVPSVMPKFAPGPLPAPSSGHHAAAAHRYLPQAIAPTSASKKRKPDALDNGSDSAGVQPSKIAGHVAHSSDVTDDCDVVRAKIRAFIESGEMKVGEFQRAIGISSTAYSTFMKQEGPAAGHRCAAYKNAFAYFMQREQGGLNAGGPVAASSGSAANKKAKTDNTTKNLDVSGVTLPGEGHGRVPVFDTCNEIRRKIRAFLQKEGLSQAAFCRELTLMVAEEGRRVNASSLAKFLGQKGPTGGAGSIVFYAAYVYFEKLRVRDGKPKSKTREEMESVWGRDGMDLPEEGRGGGQRSFWCLGNERPYEDKYGKVHFIGR